MQDWNCEDPNLQYKEGQLLQSLIQHCNVNSWGSIIPQAALQRTHERTEGKEKVIDIMQIRRKETQTKAVGTKGERYIQEIFGDRINMT